MKRNNGFELPLFGSPDTQADSGLEFWLNRDIEIRDSKKLTFGSNDDTYMCFDTGEDALVFRTAKPCMERGMTTGQDNIAIDSYAPINPRMAGRLAGVVERASLYSEILGHQFSNEEGRR